LRRRVQNFLIVAVATSFTLTASGSSQTPADVRVTPVSDFRDQTAYDGAESPNGRFVVTADESGNFVRHDRKTKKWATDSSIKLQQFRWSPDGRFLAYTASLPGTRERYVWVVPMDTATGLPKGTPRRISTHAGAWSTWSPDGKRIAFVAADSGKTRVMVVPFNGGDGEILYEAKASFGAGNYARIVWSPDGAYILGPGATQWLRINVRTKHVDSIPLAAMAIVGYSPDGKRIAQFNYQQQVIVISSAADGHELARLSLPQRVFPIGWSATTPNALTALHNPIPGGVQRVSLPEGALSTVAPVADEIGGVRYSADGRQVAFVRHGLAFGQMFVSGSDGTNAHRVGSPGVISNFRWSPDGKQIAYLTSGIVPSVHLIDVASNRDRALVTAGKSSSIGRDAIGWRSDGQAVRYVWRPHGAASPEREAREVTTTGQTRTLAQAAIPAADLNREPARPHFINDTLMLLRGRDQITAVNLRTGTTRSLYSGHIRSLDEFGVSADGQWIAFAAWIGENSTPLLLSLVTGEQRHVPYTLRAELGEMSFHPDGRYLVATACTKCENDERWDLILIPLNGDPARILTDSERDYRSFGYLSMAADGKSIIFGSEKSWTARLVTVTLPSP
jgi:Tol biopolymer transport system component